MALKNCKELRHIHSLTIIRRKPTVIKYEFIEGKYYPRIEMAWFSKQGHEH